MPTNHACVYADATPYEYLPIPDIEGSALLDLRDLRVLRAAGWRIYLTPRAATPCSSSAASLALTELCTPTRRYRYHQRLLDAVLHGGERHCLCGNQTRPRSPSVRLESFLLKKMTCGA